MDDVSRPALLGEVLADVLDELRLRALPANDGDPDQFPRLGVARCGALLDGSAGAQSPGWVQLLARKRD